MRERNGTIKYKFNDGFSLVELIIVIAIMAILAAAIAPALIRYIDKSRKADDVAAADAIGTTVQAGINSSDEAYDYVMKHASNANDTNHKYRIVCYMSCGVHNNINGWHFVNCGDSNLDAAGKAALKEQLEDLMGQKVLKLKFWKKDTFDQWIICTDKDGNLNIFVTGGMTNNIYFIEDDLYFNTGHRNRVYRLWPDPEPEYYKLTRGDISVYRTRP